MKPDRHPSKPWPQSPRPIMSIKYSREGGRERGREREGERGREGEGERETKGGIGPRRNWVVIGTRRLHVPVVSSESGPSVDTCNSTYR